MGPLCLLAISLAKRQPHQENPRAMSQCRRHNTHAPALVGVAVVSAFLAAGPALAGSRQAQEKVAREACLNGNYTEGVAILSKLFVETKDATYIFNQGRCFEQNRRYEDAIARFQEFLRAGRKKLDANEKAEAEQHIEDCKQMLAQERASSTAASTPQPVVAPPSIAPPAAQPLPPTAPSIVEQAVPPPRPTQGSKGAGLRIGGIAVGAFGVAALGAGVLLNMKANSTVDDMYSSYDGYSKESDRKTYETWAWVGYGVGAACIVTGAVLYAIGLKAKSSQPSSVAVVPAVGANQAGAVLTGAF